MGYVEHEAGVTKSRLDIDLGEKSFNLKRWVRNPSKN
jgi:hypothetical protein